MAIVAYFLYVQIGWPSFVGIGLFLFLAPAQMFMGRLLMRFRYDNSRFLGMPSSLSTQ